MIRHKLWQTKKIGRWKGYLTFFFWFTAAIFFFVEEKMLYHWKTQWYKIKMWNKRMIKTVINTWFLPLKVNLYFFFLTFNQTKTLKVVIVISLYFCHWLSKNITLFGRKSNNYLKIKRNLIKCRKMGNSIVFLLSMKKKESKWRISSKKKMTTFTIIC